MSFVSASGPTPAPVQSSSVTPGGDLTITFSVPPSSFGAATVKITDGSTVVDAGGTFMVAPVASNNGLATSLSQYHVGISQIRYWLTQGPPSSTGSSFSTDPTACQGDINRADQVQMLTATATAPDGTSDQVNFTVADPGFIPPSLTVTETPNLATQGNPLTFTANLTPPGPPPTTGSITWTWLVAPPGTPACPASSVPPLTATCTVSNAQGGQQYEVEATYSGDQNYSFISATSPTIYVWPPTQLTFTSPPPTSATDGSTWPSSVQVSVQDLNGDPEHSNGDNITLALSNPPPGAILSCAGTQPAINGLATFSGCSFTGPIGSYNLTATDDSESLPVATSGAVSITLGPPDHLSSPARRQLAPPTAKSWPSRCTSASRTSATTPSPPTPPTTSPWVCRPALAFNCTGGPTHQASNGVARFSGCSITGLIGPYTLTATDATETLPGPPPTSNPVTIKLGPATQLAFTGQPPATGETSGAIWPNPVEVSIEDVGDNPITTNSTDDITLGLSNPLPVPSSAAPAHPTGQQRGRHLLRLLHRRANRVLHPRRHRRHHEEPSCRQIQHRLDSAMTRHQHRRRDERGTSLILALVFIFAVGMVLVAVGGLAANALLNTNNADAERTSAQDAENAVTIAIQYVRYLPALPSPSLCLPPGSTIPSSGQGNGANNLEVYCTTTVQRTNSRTRVVEFYACPSGTSPGTVGRALCFTLRSPTTT